MKMFIFGIIYLLSSTSAFPNEYSGKEAQKGLSNIDFGVLPIELVEKLTEKFDADPELGLNDINVIVNEYADKIFANLRNYINNHNLNDMSIPDAELKLKPSGKINLTNGHLEDLNTIGRRDDIVVTYSSTDKKILIACPIMFEDVKFSYDYRTKVLFIKMHGGVHGSVKNIQVQADLSFDFITHHASLDHYTMQHSGKVSVKFTGNKAIDWLTNAMSSVITTFMGQVIMNVLAKFIRENLRDIIEVVNEAIDKIIQG